ncbi:unnamed protein product [Didymodactylos carnosus]|uniref:Tetraspanin n=1 Tax=Didymodactylos carnosus TaxID=1234261 RepID=A0A813Z491_9BILA|nr:unnamed protein product [Didymodactylos carnosus]CAF1190336.1 unnamed protein product [Didymodactylos carnosus]CAF3676989.1 unnamed protein product [Didymodactylos carnosus]CAF4001379.1 unnamed protein product [Didymodactylos carnosus]
MAHGKGRGGMACCMKFGRFIMVTVNILFVLIGIALLALGIYVMVDPKFQKIKTLLPITGDPNVQQGLSYIEMIGIVVIVFGGVLLILGFLGCCGTIRQYKWMLTLYAIIIGAIILAEVAMTIYFVAFQSKFADVFIPKLQASIRDNYNGPPIFNNTPSAASLAWDFVMYNLQCCGANNREDFNNTPKWNKTDPFNSTQNFLYPLTCCPLANYQQDWNTLSQNILHQGETCAVQGNGTFSSGCYGKLMDLIGSYKTYIIIGAVIILVIELLAFIFAITLCCRKRRQDRYSS